MPMLERPDGAAIWYSSRGAGAPLLLIRGGPGSGHQGFAVSQEVLDAYQLIVVDERHSGRSRAPAEPFDYARSVADYLAVLDALSLSRVLVLASGHGCALALRLIYDASARVLAAVCLQPPGAADGNWPSVFYAPFNVTLRVARAGGMEAVVRAALAEPDFGRNPAAGPFAKRLHDDPSFRAELGALPVESYATLIVRYRDGLWPPRLPFFSVPPEWLPQCPAPLLVAPGADRLHPRDAGLLICRLAPSARCLEGDVEARVAIRAFLEQNRDAGL